MDRQAAHSSSFSSLITSLYQNNQLIIQMVRREILARYKGSVLGLFWSFFNPLLMLSIYTFVFSIIFKSRWEGNNDTSNTQFAILLFVGLIMQNLFAEVINRAPNLIVSNVNYVKKVIFPLEILPIITLGTALFHWLMSLLVLLAVFILFNGYLHWTILFIPFIVLPFIILILGLAWMLVSFGVFLRDIGQTITIITTVLLFLSPTFYPITAVPESIRPLILANPLTFIIEQTREVLIWGRKPDWLGLAFYYSISILVAWLGYAWFQKSRKSFADVL